MLISITLSYYFAGLSIKFNVAEWLGAGKVNGKNDSHNVSKLHIKHAKKFAANVCSMYFVIFYYTHAKTLF